ncbi:unnamed protein product [marine sediment metagenome]|uniref:Uncharacterized protein n=1 Tax=marine sediment metagenome TaxID=412755 RepID=X0XXJ1_9ZZZZ
MSGQCHHGNYTGYDCFQCLQEEKKTDQRTNREILLEILAELKELNGKTKQYRVVCGELFEVVDGVPPGPFVVTDEAPAK